MNVYEISVHGGCPGHDGIIVVVAATKRSALAMARTELERLNEARRSKNAVLFPDVTLDEESITLTRKGFTTGVVYAYDGEY